MILVHRTEVEPHTDQKQDPGKAEERDKDGVQRNTESKS